MLVSLNVLIWLRSNVKGIIREKIKTILFCYSYGGVNQKNCSCVPLIEIKNLELQKEIERSLIC